MRVKRFHWLGVLALGFGFPAAASAAEPAAAARPPEAVYKTHCAGCHDPGEGHPGTMMLGITRGKDKAVLKGRSELPVEYIEQIVREGLLEMAPFRKTEITDVELRSLAQWLRTPGS